MIGRDIAEGNGIVLLEVGCGPGNMVYPVSVGLMKCSTHADAMARQVIQRNATIKAHCCDFSDRAVELLRVSCGLDREAPS